MKNTILVLGFALCSISVHSEQIEKIVFDFNATRQTIHSFGASDCWRVQYIGKNWPLEKREKMADLLFCSDVDEWGNPKGIGLSLWRFNIGSGSHEAGDASGVASAWRRTECFLDKDGNWDWSKQEGQRWMLEAARKRGVRYALGFSITAPYFMTKNGMARASEKNRFANIREDQYDDYATFMAEVSTKLGFDYISPINEPQWEWIGNGQEGMQATNAECGRLIHLLDKELEQRKAKTKVVFGEAADIRYLYRSGTDKPERDNQLKEIFSKDGAHSIYGLASVAPIVSGHSYWSTWPLDTLVQTRKELSGELMRQLPPHYTYWQTEYCPMEQNTDNPHGGGGRDLGMNTALYVARVIHYDLTVANASSWQWWTAFSEWDYKDGLIFIDDGMLANGASRGDEKMIETCKYDGTFRASKLLWTLGNYSFFIKPGMTRIAKVNKSDDPLAKGLLASAYVDFLTNKVVVVIINMTNHDISTEISFLSIPANWDVGKFNMYETSTRCNLQLKGIAGGKLKIPSQSVITLVNCHGNALE